MTVAPARLTALMFGAWLSLLGSSAVAQVPQKLNYQGFLTSAAGTPIDVPAGVQMKFELFGALSGGPAKYELCAAATVQGRRGLAHTG